MDNKIEALQRVISNLATENLELKRRLTKVEGEYKKIGNLAEEMEKVIGRERTQNEIFRLGMKKLEEYEQRQKEWRDSIGRDDD